MPRIEFRGKGEEFSFLRHHTCKVTGSNPIGCLAGLCASTWLWNVGLPESQNSENIMMNIGEWCCYWSKNDLRTAYWLIEIRVSQVVLLMLLLSWSITFIYGRLSLFSTSGNLHFIYICQIRNFNNADLCSINNLSLII